MNKKELLEFVFNGLEEQFKELGVCVTTASESEIAVIAQERRATAISLLNVKNLIDELEKEEAQSKVEEEVYKNMSDYGKCIVELIDSIGELKAAGYKNKQLVDMLEEHTKDDISKNDIRVIKEIFENEIGYFEG